LNIPATATNDDQEVALDKLRRGEIAAMAFVAGKPAPIFRNLNALSLRAPARSLPHRIISGADHAVVPNRHTMASLVASVRNLPNLPFDPDAAGCCTRWFSRSAT
jgi:hypothetical protein